MVEKLGKAKFILLLQSEHGKDAITSAARLYALHKQVPPEHCFSSYWAEYVFKEFRKPTSASLRLATKDDKLFIFGHGSPDGIAWMDGLREAKDGEERHTIISESRAANSQALAKYLAEMGLKEMGLITFKACSVGNGTFLTHFARALEARGIRVGWLKGYKGYTSSLTVDADEVAEPEPGAEDDDNWKFSPEYRKRLQESTKIGFDKDKRQRFAIPKVHDAVFPFKSKGEDEYIQMIEAKVKVGDYQDALADDVKRLKIVRGPGKLFEGQQFGKNDRFVGKGLTGDVLFPPN